MKGQTPTIEPKQIFDTILAVRERRVILGADLARIYGVPVKRLNEQVKRNLERFPDDFMFRLTPQETESLRSQSATLNKRGRD